MKHPHVGEILRDLYFYPIGISISKLAKELNITRQALSSLLNEKSGISPKLAIKLSKRFGTTPEFWWNLNCTYILNNEKD